MNAIVVFLKLFTGALKKLECMKKSHSLQKVKLLYDMNSLHIVEYKTDISGFQELF